MIKIWMMRISLGELIVAIRVKKRDCRKWWAILGLNQ